MTKKTTEYVGKNMYMLLGRGTRRIHENFNIKQNSETYLKSKNTSSILFPTINSQNYLWIEKMEFLNKKAGKAVANT